MALGDAVVCRIYRAAGVDVADYRGNGEQGEEGAASEFFQACPVGARSFWEEAEGLEWLLVDGYLFLARAYLLDGSVAVVLI